MEYSHITDNSWDRESDRGRFTKFVLRRIRKNPPMTRIIEGLSIELGLIHGMTLQGKLHQLID